MISSCNFVHVTVISALCGVRFPTGNGEKLLVQTQRPSDHKSRGARRRRWQVVSFARLQDGAAVGYAAILCVARDRRDCLERVRGLELEIAGVGDDLELLESEDSTAAVGQVHGEGVMGV